MLKKLPMLGPSFLDYIELRKGKALTIPGYIGFLASHQPSWYKKYCARSIRKHPEFETISDIIHGVITDGSVDGIFKADNYLKNFHNWDTRELDLNLTIIDPFKIYDE